MDVNTTNPGAIMNDLSISVLFVCLGNTCRSPIAEGVFRKLVNEMNLFDNWEIDSAGIADWHVGNPPSRRSREIMKMHKVPYSHIARQITTEDFSNFDYIIGMDDWNMKELNEMAPQGSKAKLLLFGDFDPQGERIIRDPYFDSGLHGFEKCYEQSMRCGKGFLEHLMKLHNITNSSTCSISTYYN